jgi:hypothetical protein
VTAQPGIRVDIKRLLLARSLKPLPGNEALVHALQGHAADVFGEPIPTSGTPLYTDVRLYSERGIPAVIYGAGPRTVFESKATPSGLTSTWCSTICGARRRWWPAPSSTCWPRSCRRSHGRVSEFRQANKHSGDVFFGVRAIAWPHG